MEKPPAPTFPFDQEIVWYPKPEWIAASNLQRFMTAHGIGSYDELMARSTSDIAWFWDAALEDLDVEFYRPYTRVVDFSDGKPFPRWCVDGELNIVHNMLDRRRQGEEADRIALYWEGEEGVRLHLTYRELHREVCRCANALTRLGIGRGDVVGLFMPMTPELIIAFIASVKVGGIVLPLFSGYGPGAIARRLSDAQASVLFTSNGFLRRGSAVAMKEVADAALAEAPSVKHVIVHRRVALDVAVPWREGRDYWWHEFIPLQPEEAETVRTAAEDVLMIIYTSGTTGRPKGAVHTHCGFPVKAAQDMYHAMDLKPGEVMYWMTDMGWMMGPWLVFGTLLIGAAMVIYDGAPDYPDPDRLWRIVEHHGVTHLGVSPTLVRALKSRGAIPHTRDATRTLRAIGSTGSPWDPESWMWLFQNVLDGQRPILNYSGGTEISGGILCGNFFRPLKPCAFSDPVPGMDADVVDPDGKSIRGQVGELVLRKPWIGMTRGFWKDTERYLDTYWSRFKDIWVHGDFAAIDDGGLWYILGRSDDTINISGKRLGPAEIEAVLVAHPSVAEVAAVGVPDYVKGQDVVVFVVLQPGHTTNEDLRRDLMRMIVAEMGKALKPREIKFVGALPKTRNAKIMRRVIRAVYLDEDPGDVTNLEDAAALTAIKEAV